MLFRSLLRQIQRVGDPERGSAQMSDDRHADLGLSRATGGDQHPLMPLAVIVNGNSASASEIFAGAIQDYGKGTIIGTQTYGKGIVQTVKPLTDGSAIKFTIAKYFTPKGQDIHGKGVTPDMVVEYDTDADVDTQLDAAIKMDVRLEVSARNPKATEPYMSTIN